MSIGTRQNRAKVMREPVTGGAFRRKHTRSSRAREVAISEGLTWPPSALRRLAAALATFRPIPGAEGLER